MNLLGLHHITAITSDVQKNFDFYTHVLGLRFVKRTVNFDDPHTYHLYYGDEKGSPGTILTFFPWKDLPNGKRGTGQATGIGYVISKDSKKYWRKRLKDHKITYEESQRFEDKVLSFEDPDGLLIELISSELAIKQDNHAWRSEIPMEHAIRGFHSVTLTEAGYEETAALLENMGFQKKGEENNRHRFQPLADALPLNFIDLLCAPNKLPGTLGYGTVHHVAFRTKDDVSEIKDRKELIKLHRNPTTVIDRIYFRSVYFKEPGGILFEIATDSPGFTIDENIDELGMHLKIPPWYEHFRRDIEKELPELKITNG